MRKANISLSGKNSNPKRIKSPDWRYNYVVQLLDDWREPRKEDDIYIQELYNLLKVIRQEPVDVVETYKDNHIEAANALVIFEQGAYSRVDVDTRILAGYSFEEIAEIVGHSPKTVEYYTMFFFDVLDSLTNYGYLNRWVIEPVMRIAPYSNEAFMKRIAIFGGREMLQSIEKCSLHQVSKMFETLFDNLLLSKAIQAANGVTPNARNAVELIGLAKDNINERKKIEAMFGGVKEDDTFTSQVVSVMLKSFTYGLLTQNTLPADPLRAETSIDVNAAYGDNPPKFIDKSVGENK